MSWAGVLAVVGIIVFPVLALMLASLGGWPGLAGAFGVCVVIFAVTVWLDTRPPRDRRGTRA